MAITLASKDAIKFQLGLSYSQKFNPEVYLNLTFFPQLWILHCVILQIKKNAVSTRFCWKKKKKLAGIFIEVQVDILLVCVFIFGIFYGFHISQHLIRINQCIFTKPSDAAWLPWACVFSLSLIVTSAFLLICCLLPLSQCTILAGSICCKEVNPLLTLLVRQSRALTPNSHRDTEQLLQDQKEHLWLRQELSCLS